MVLSSTDSEAEQPKRPIRRKKKIIATVILSDSDQNDDEGDSDYTPPPPTAETDSDSDNKENDESSPPLRKKEPEGPSTPVGCSSSSRRSCRLESRETERSKFDTPDRRKYLEEISPRLPKGEKPGSGIRKKLYANNLVLGYVSESTVGSVNSLF